MEASLDAHARAGTDPPRHLPALDGLRAVAVLAVVWFHVAALVPGISRGVLDVSSQFNLGVDIFFVLSGYLIYGPFARAHLSGRPLPDVWRYGRRRALRIYPGYLVAFTILWAVGWIRAGSLVDVLSNLSLTHLYVDASPAAGIAQSWSLVVEVSFYLFVPLWALLIRAAARRCPLHVRWRAELGAALALIPVGLVASWADIYHDPPRALTVLPPEMATLGAGMALAVLAARREVASPPARDGRRSPAVPATGWWWLAALAVLAVTLTRPFGFWWASQAERMWQALWHPLIAVLVVAPVALAARPGAAGRWLARPVMVGIGVVSYGVYLWHLAVIEEFVAHPMSGRAVVTAVATLIATLCIATISYGLVERPAMGWAARLRRRPAAEPVNA